MIKDERQNEYEKKYKKHNHRTKYDPKHDCAQQTLFVQL